MARKKKADETPDTVKLVAVAGFDGPEGTVKIGDTLTVSRERADHLTDTLHVTIPA